MKICRKGTQGARGGRPQGLVAARRRTCFPLSARQVHAERVELALLLDEKDFSARGIRQILNLSGPDVARRLVARGLTQRRKGAEKRI